jgi:protein involved in polysaccharide export with SLBB domain
MSSVDAFLLDRTKIPRELHNAHFFSIHATKSSETANVNSFAVSVFSHIFGACRIAQTAPKRLLSLSAAVLRAGLVRAWRRESATFFFLPTFIFMNFMILRARRFVFVAFALACFGGGLFAQSRGGQLGGEMDKLFQPDAGVASLANSSLAAGFVVDNVVNPNYYFVGPGDVLLVEIVGPVSLTVPLTVSPESLVLLPRLGEVSVEGKTLAAVKTEIQRLVQQRNANNRAYIALQRPRTVYVRISGNVAAPGLYALPASLRVSSAVAIANQETATSAKERVASPNAAAARINDYNSVAPNGQYIVRFSQRYVKVLHRDGSSEIADAVRARFTSMSFADPTVRESDEIYVPFDHEASDEFFGSISIAGAVERPCVLPYRKGDRASLLLKAAFGLAASADSNAIDLVETVFAGSDSSPKTSRRLSLCGILSGEDDIELESGASIIVRAKEVAEPKRAMATILGEVHSPGAYAITSGVTRLADLVKRAGGLTGKAYLPLSTIERRSVKSFPAHASEAEIMRNFQYTTLTPEDTLRYKLDEFMRRPFVACDFTAALENASESDNVPLQDGDIVTLAANPRNIFVFGQVNKPGFIEVTHLEGRDRFADWYIRAAGGFAPGADTSRVRIIKGRNRLWIEPFTVNAAGRKEYARLEAGDQIYVPRIPDANADLALKRLTVELQKEGLEVQKEGLEAQKNATIWQLVIGIISTGTSLFFLGRGLGIW